MTTKQKVNLDGYHKAPRRLADGMEAALRPGGDLHSVFEAVMQDERLRLEIRERRFNQSAVNNFPSHHRHQAVARFDARA